FQLPIGWLKAVAPSNRLDRLVTFPTAQFPMGWLNAVAFQNIPTISTTAATSQPVISPLNAPVNANPPNRTVTFETSQWSRSLFSTVQPRKMFRMLATLAKSGASDAFTCRFEQP